MSLRPFLEASLVIQIHEIAGLLAFVLGAFVLWRRKGNATHKFWGKIWVGLMLVTALSSIFIHEIKLWGNYSPIHLLTLLVLINMPLGIWFARSGKIERHKHTMQGTYIGGMVIAGGLTFLPGRMNYQMLIGDGQYIGGLTASMLGIGGAVLGFLILSRMEAKGLK